MIYRFTKPQAELYQAVLDIQKSCLSLCSPGMCLENIYSLMLSLIGQKLKDLGILQSSVTESHYFKVLGLTVSLLGYVSGYSLAQKCAFQMYLLIAAMHCALIHVVGWSQDWICLRQS